MYPRMYSILPYKPSSALTLHALDLWMASCMISVFAALGEFVIVKVLQGKYQVLKQKEAEAARERVITPWTGEFSSKSGNHLSYTRVGRKGWLAVYWRTDKGKVKIMWKEIDRIARIIFPSLFFLFTVMYWSILMLGSRSH